MYTRYAERNRMRIEPMELDEGNAGRPSRRRSSRCAAIGAYGLLRHESGVHRVQRVPATETQGRIHTSAATVAVLPGSGRSGRAH